MNIIITYNNIWGIIFEEKKIFFAYNNISWKFKISCYRHLIELVSNFAGEVFKIIAFVYCLVTKQKNF